MRSISCPPQLIWGLANVCNIMLKSISLFKTLTSLTSSSITGSNEVSTPCTRTVLMLGLMERTGESLGSHEVASCPKTLAWAGVSTWRTTLFEEWC